FEAIEAIRPLAVIATGQAGGSDSIEIERVAINWIDAKIPDELGQQPIDCPVIPGAPAAYFSTLPLRSIFEHLTKAGIPARLSMSAGTFVCNSLFYHLMHRVHSLSLPILAGFIHVPFVEEQAAHHAARLQKKPPFMRLDQIICALRIASEISHKAALANRW
ncbi:MAG: pyroglutamyl-peptidase I, partial [Deltaproteobacteria bacterium]|nr:pyroglutamyl-peptidase I [Deltaproteobacteria bacterium]